MFTKESLAGEREITERNQPDPGEESRRRGGPGGQRASGDRGAPFGGLGARNGGRIRFVGGEVGRSGRVNDGEGVLVGD